MYVVHYTCTSSLWRGAKSISNGIFCFSFLDFIGYYLMVFYVIGASPPPVERNSRPMLFIVFGGFHGFGRTKCFFMALESVLLPGERNSLAPILVPTLPPRSQHLASNPILINNPNLSTSIQTNPILTNNPNRPKSLNNMLQWSLGWPPSTIQWIITKK